jgi:hypothetical protein
MGMQHAQQEVFPIVVAGAFEHSLPPLPPISVACPHGEHTSCFWCCLSCCGLR